MIDSMYQAEIDRNLDQLVRRPLTDPPPPPGNFAGFWRAGGAVPAGALDAAGSMSDIATGTGEITESLGLRPPNNSGILTADDIDQADASRERISKRIAARGVDWNSPWHDDLRATAKSFMPDPKTTGAATQLLAGVTHFGVQAVPSMIAGGPMGPVIVAGLAGTQEADKLAEQGVDVETRTNAATAAGVAAGASMVLPMGGATWLVRGAKGAAGGVASVAGQAEAEKLILEHQGYDQIASQYDPLDPTSLALGALVPGLFGAAFGHPVRTDKEMKTAATLTPAEAAHSDAMEQPNTPGDTHTSAADEADFQRLLKTATPEERADLLRSRELAHRENVGRAAAEDPNLVAAARTNQAAAALDASRLTPDDDLAGRDQHAQAVETAADQIARGERVDVTDIVRPEPASPFTATEVEIEVKGKRVMVPGLTAEFDNGHGSKGVMDLAMVDGRLYPSWVDAGLPSFNGEMSTGGRVRALYEQAIEEARRRGLEFTSDKSVAIGAQRIYDSLERRGYDIERNPAARDTKPGDEFSDRKVTDDGSPVYRVRSRSPAATAAALDQMRASREAPVVESRPATPNASSHEPAAAPAMKEPAAAATAAPSDAGGTGPATGPEPSHLEAAVAEIARTSPDMMVEMEGMGAMRVDDLLEAVRRDAALETRDSRLLEVAAQCAIRN